MEEKDKRLCFNCGKHWPHQWVARNCLGFGKRCTRSGKINHVAKYCKSKHEGKPSKELAHKGENITDTSFKSGEESTCSLENVNRWTINHFGKVIISGAIITFLDNAMDEATFHWYGLKKKRQDKKKIFRRQMKPFGVAEESNLIPVIGSFEAPTESDHESKMKVVTWQLVKGAPRRHRYCATRMGKTWEWYWWATQYQIETNIWRMWTAQLICWKNTKIDSKEWERWQVFRWIRSPSDRASISINFSSRFTNRPIFSCNALESDECAWCLMPVWHKTIELSFLYFHWLFPL